MSRSSSDALQQTKMGARDSQKQNGSVPLGAGVANAMICLNVISLAIYAVEWNSTGTVVTTSGNRAQGHHEGPALLALLAFLHQLFFDQRNGWHPIVGRIAILSTIVCLAMASKNLKSGIEKQFIWAEALPIENEVLKRVMLVWNEAVNIHQFLVYGPLLINQLWRGYQTAKDRKIKQHESHMRSAMLFLLGPLSQRFMFNHFTERAEDMGIYFQVVTYSMLMAVLVEYTASRYSLRISLGIALVAAVMFVRNETSVLSYLLAVA